MNESLSHGQYRVIRIPIWNVFRSEWKYWSVGSIVIYILINIYYSNYKYWFFPDISIPYCHESDCLFTDWMAQRVIEGWLYENPRSGYPFGSSFYDFPQSDIGTFILIKLLGLAFNDFQLVLNIYYVLGYSVVFVAAYLVLRSIGVSISFAISGAVIFDILPFHFLRLPHLFYTWYFLVPLFFYLGFSIYSSSASKIFNNKLLLLGLWLLVAASFGVYNALFGVITLLTFGIAGAVAQRRMRPLILSGVYTFIVAIGVAVNIAPNIAYRFINGPNPAVAQREAIESEIYGLKLIQLVMPRQGHRSEYLSRISSNYNNKAPLINENVSSALGIVSVIGLIALMGAVIVRISGGMVDLRVSLLGLVVLVLFLFGVSGGFGLVFSMLVSPAIRSWNRISVFIGFGALATIFILMQSGLKRIIDTRILVYVQLVIGIGLVTFAIYDQTSQVDMVYYDRSKSSFLTDKKFIEDIETNVPHGAAIYQLPYIAFPEGGLGELSYNNLTGYLHSKSLLWSSGGMKGRQGDLFFRALSHEPVRLQIEVVRRLGFSGIYIFRLGYADKGEQVIREITSVLGYGPDLKRDDDQVVFYRLRNMQPISFEGLTAAEIMERVGYIVDGNDVRYKIGL